MLRRIATTMVATALLLPAALPAYAAESVNNPTSGELVTQAKKWDGREIVYTGEVITEALERGDYSWIHVNDDAYYLKNVEEGAPLGGYNSGHAIWLPTELTEQITYWGDYRHEGDVVTVRGTFNAACGQHGGDMDIHADSLEVVLVGHMAEDPLHPWKIGLALGLSLAAGAAWAANRREQFRRGRGGQSG